MREILVFWKNKTLSQKKLIKDKYKLEKITYENIKTIYKDETNK